MIQSKKSIKMRVVDWWEPDNAENFYNNFFIKLLCKKYDVVYSDTPDFIIYGAHGYAHLDYDCVRIFITGENIRTDWNIADYGIDVDYMAFGDRHCFVPCFLNTCKEGDIMQRKIIKKTKFCAFMATNGSSAFRNDFFDELSKYKRVDSGGRYKNNIGGAIGDRFGDFASSKLEWLKDYKFHICFENSSYCGYLSEKLFHAFVAGCVPIYWGDTSLRCDESSLWNNENWGGAA